MAATNVYFNFDEVVKTVKYHDGRANWDDAEEAVQGAAELLLKRGEPLIPSYVAKEGFSVLGRILKRADRRSVSLDVLLLPGASSDKRRMPELAMSRIVPPLIREWSAEVCLYALRRWTELHGRTPTYNECRSDIWLPTPAKLHYALGMSLNESLKMAGLPTREAGGRDRQVQPIKGVSQ